jgi:NACHT domain
MKQIFSPSPAGDQKWSNFAQFLESDQGIYWITGKPGSGKSTLMKFIKNNQRTAAHLSRWAEHKELYLSGFYFWCSGGNEIQMTLEGLLRTLIHQALEDLPDLAPLIFPKRLGTFVVFGSQIVWEEPWTLTELLSAFKLFVYETTKSKRIFLLIDGLDEFNGNYSQQVKLVEFIRSLLSSDIKICVSSRPWNVFEDAFNTSPSLRLEDLTYKDIQHHCSSALSNNLGFTALQHGDPKTASDLIGNVSMKASGVFLWVILVIQSLLEGLTDGERLSDLEALFWRILNSVDLERVSQLIQIVRASSGSISILELSYADEDDPSFIFNMTTKPLPRATLESRAEIMRRRLNACCKGLLEPQGPYAKHDPHTRVGYLHRTVKDFIEKNDVWDKLLKATNVSFDPGMRLSISCLSSLKLTNLALVVLSRIREGIMEGYDSVSRDPAQFWIDVVHCIWNIRLGGTQSYSGRNTG